MAKSSEKSKLPLDDCTRPQLLKLFDHDRKFERKFCDAILRAGEKRFPVHRAVLGLVSEYFENLFNVEMKEKFAPEININLPAENLERILDYIYTDVSGISTDNALDLLEDAEYTQIGFLKAQCAKFILQMVDVENCLKLLAYAQRYNLAKIVDKANQVIYKNFTVVVHQDDFRQLKADAMSAIIGNENIKALVRDNVRCSVAVMDALTNHLPPQEATKVMRMGGEHSERQCVLYNAKNGQKEVLPPLINDAVDATAVRMGNKIFVFGGEGAMRSCQMFDLTDRTWTPLADIPEGRRCAACAVLNGLIYITGGFDDDVNASSTCFIYDPGNNSWSRAPNMTEPRSRHAMLQFNGSLFVFGGDKPPCKSCEKFADNQWTAIAPMQEGRFGFTAVEVGGLLYAIGGSEGLRLPSNTVECYDYRTNTWSRVQSMNVERSDHGACVLQGKVYVIGDAWQDDKSVEVYDPQENTWTVCFQTDNAVYSACIVAL